MAQLALTVGGGIIGSFFGAPQLGLIAGSLVANLLFPPKGQNIEGPRLSDKSVTSSAYGNVIAVCYGTVKVNGNIIWTGGIEEQKNVQSSGGGKGLGGPKSTQTTYTYFASFAISFAEGPADTLIRLWFDNKLVFDATTTETTTRAGLRYRFHSGTETQDPDPLIEADKGEGNTPAYRGQVYMVFERLELTDFGNRIPSVAAEIAFDATSANQVLPSTDISGGAFDQGDDDVIFWDRRRRKIYTADNLTGDTGLRVYDSDDLVEVREQLNAIITQDSLGDVVNMNSGMAVGASGYIYASTNSFPKKPIIRINPSSLVEDRRYGAIGDAHPDVLHNPLNMVEMLAFSPLNGAAVTFLLVAEATGTAPSKFEGITVLDMEKEDLVTRRTDLTGVGTTTNNRTGLCVEEPRTGGTTAWVGRSEGGNNDIEIHRVDMEVKLSIGLSGPGTTATAFINDAQTIAATNWNSDGAADQAIGPILDRDDGGLIFIVDRSSATGCFVIKWNETDGVVWVTEVEDVDAPGSTSQGGYSAITRDGYADNGIFGFVGSNGDAILIDTTTGTIILEAFDVRAELGTDWPTSVREQIFDPESVSISIAIQGEPALRRVYLNRFSGQTVLLSDVVSDISGRVGLEASQLDVTELTDEVRGYILGRQMSARAAIGPLASAYFFDGVESDGKVDFKKRGRASSAALTPADMMTMNDETGEIFPETRTQEVELPQRISLSFFDVNFDHQVGAVSAKRILNPSPAVFSNDEREVQLPLVLTPTEARTIAERTLNIAWQERRAHEFMLPWEYLELDPADVVDVTLNSGTVVKARIAEIIVNGDMSLGVKSIAEDTDAVVSSNITGQGAEGFTAQTVARDLFTNLLMFDIPLLQDLDDAGNFASRVYCGANGFADGWKGATLWESSNAATFDDTNIRFLNGMEFGTVQNALPATTLPFQTDTTTELTVFMEQGVLASVSNADFLNNANAALVGSPVTQNYEVILFRDVVDNGNGSYTVSHIMRARRGTDARTDNHVNGEQFIVLSNSTIESLLLDTALVGTVRFYKGVGINQIPERADTVGFTGNGTDLKPYAPCLLDAVVDGSSNIDISWERRTRVAGALVDLTGDVPLAEESESYEIDIKDGPDGTVLRTLTAVTTSDQYDNADIVTDFGGVPASLSFEIFQMSATVGRGFGKEVTITF